nr:DUF4233 domain-containing protein [Amycolatopsis granulosa]
MKSFRGVMAGTLICEAITVGLALPVIANLGGGIGTLAGWGIIVIAVLHVLLCGVLKRRWAVPVILVLQVALVVYFVEQVAIGIIGLLFLAFWLWALWLRNDVARRMAEGRLPSQQQPSE